MPIKYKNDSLAALNAAYSNAIAARQAAKSDLDPLYKFADALAQRGQAQAAREIEQRRITAGKIGAILDYLASHERNAAATSSADAQFKAWLAANRAAQPAQSTAATTSADASAPLDITGVLNDEMPNAAPTFHNPLAPATTEPQNNTINAATDTSAPKLNSNLILAQTDNRQPLDPANAVREQPSQTAAAPIFNPRDTDGQRTNKSAPTLMFR